MGQAKYSNRGTTHLRQLYSAESKQMCEIAHTTQVASVPPSASFSIGERGCLHDVRIRALATMKPHVCERQTFIVNWQIGGGGRVRRVDITASHRKPFTLALPQMPTLIDLFSDCHVACTSDFSAPGIFST